MDKKDLSLWLCRLRIRGCSRESSGVGDEPKDRCI